MITINIT